MDFYRKVRNFLFSYLIISNYALISHASVEVGFEEEKNINKQINLNINYLKRYPKDNYILGPGDFVKIVISRNYPELSSLKLIDGDGSLYLPLVNRVYVAGLTIQELNKLLGDLYEEFVKYPDLECEVIRYRPVKFFVEGEVSEPGLYTIEGGRNSLGKKNDPIILDEFENNNIKNINFESTKTFFPTVFDAIRTAKGITQYSDLKEITVIRKDTISNGAGKKITKLNFAEAINGVSNYQNIRIYDGDIIKVGKLNKSNPDLLRSAFRTNLNPKYIKVLVSGRVNQPGVKTLGKSSTLNDAIDFAGGTKLIRGPVRFISYKNDGTIDKRNITYRRRNRRGSYKNPILKDGDLIIVGNSFLSNTTEVINEVTAPFTGLYSTYSLIEKLSE